MRQCPLTDAPWSAGRPVSVLKRYEQQRHTQQQAIDHERQHAQCVKRLEEELDADECGNEGQRRSDENVIPRGGFTRLRELYSLQPARGENQRNR